MNIKQHSFWRETNGDRIILGYTGVLSDKAVIVVDLEEVVDTAWASYDELASGTIATSYGDYLQELLLK